MDHEDFRLDSDGWFKRYEYHGFTLSASGTRTLKDEIYRNVGRALGYSFEKELYGEHLTKAQRANDELRPRIDSEGPKYETFIKKYLAGRPDGEDVNGVEAALRSMIPPDDRARDIYSYKRDVRLNSAK